jgi:hypothetical protein
MPDGLYVKWKDRIRSAHPTAYPSGTVLVHLDPGEEVQNRYQTDEGDPRWTYVPESELEEYFALETYCRWQGMRCRVSQWRGEDRILIDVHRVTPEQAEEFGLTPTLERGWYVKEVPVSEVTELRQERRDLL